MTVVALPSRGQGVPLGEAVGRFLRRDVFEDTTVTAYRRTLNALLEDLGPAAPVEGCTAEQVEDLLAGRWGGTSAATFNRHRAALLSFFTWCAERGYCPTNPARATEPRKVRRSREDEKRQRPIGRDLLAALWALEKVPVRDKLLWRMAYETWARADEMLSLDVTDLDVAKREGVVHAKGGDVERVWWSTGTARLLPRVIAGRVCGPVFLSSRLPARPMPAGDVDPVSGYARLSYRQAERLFTEVGVRLDPGGAAWTLHRLRHSGIAHAVEDGWNLAQVRAKSRHSSLRSLEVYANPSADAIRAMTDALDPENRRRKR